MNTMSPEQFDREASYRAAVSICKDWLRRDFITEEEYAQIDTKLARQFRPVWGAILHEGNARNLYSA